MAAADVAGAHVQQRRAARVEPLAPQVRAQRVGPGEQQPGGGSGDRFAHERVVELERRRDRRVLVAAVADRRDDRVRRQRDGDHQRDRRHELRDAESEAVGAGDPRSRRGRHGDRGGGDPPQPAGDAREPPRGDAAPRHVGARDDEQVDCRRCHAGRPALDRPGRPALRRAAGALVGRDQHDLRRAPRHQQPQRPGPAGDVDEDRQRAERGHDQPRDRRADRDEPADRRQRAPQRERERPLRADPVRLHPRLVTARPQLVVRPDRRAALDVAAHRTRRELADSTRHRAQPTTLRGR